MIGPISGRIMHACIPKVMEYVQGGELFDHIVHKLKLQEDEARFWEVEG